MSDTGKDTEECSLSDPEKGAGKDAPLPDPEEGPGKDTEEYPLSDPEEVSSFKSLLLRPLSCLSWERRV